MVTREGRRTAVLVGVVEIPAVAQKGKYDIGSCLVEKAQADFLVIDAHYLYCKRRQGFIPATAVHAGIQFHHAEEADVFIEMHGHPADGHVADTAGDHSQQGMGEADPELHGDSFVTSAIDHFAVFIPCSVERTCINTPLIL